MERRRRRNSRTRWSYPLIGIAFGLAAVTTLPLHAVGAGAVAAHSHTSHAKQLVPFQPGDWTIYYAAGAAFKFEGTCRQNVAEGYPCFSDSDEDHFTDLMKSLTGIKTELDSVASTQHDIIDLLNKIISELNNQGVRDAYDRIAKAIDPITLAVQKDQEFLGCMSWFNTNGSKPDARQLPGCALSDAAGNPIAPTPDSPAFTYTHPTSLDDLYAGSLSSNANDLPNASAGARLLAASLGMIEAAGYNSASWATTASQAGAYLADVISGKESDQQWAMLDNYVKANTSDLATSEQAVDGPPYLTPNYVNLQNSISTYWIDLEASYYAVLQTGLGVIASQTGPNADNAKATVATLDKQESGGPSYAPGYALPAQIETWLFPAATSVPTPPTLPVPLAAAPNQGWYIDKQSKVNEVDNLTTTPTATPTQPAAEYPTKAQLDAFSAELIAHKVKYSSLPPLAPAALPADEALWANMGPSTESIHLGGICAGGPINGTKGVYKDCNAPSQTVTTEWSTGVQPSDDGQSHQGRFLRDSLSTVSDTACIAPVTIWDAHPSLDADVAVTERGDAFPNPSGYSAAPLIWGLDETQPTRRQVSTTPDVSSEILVDAGPGHTPTNWESLNLDDTYSKMNPGAVVPDYDLYFLGLTKIIYRPPSKFYPSEVVEHHTWAFGPGILLRCGGVHDPSIAAVPAAWMKVVDAPTNGGLWDSPLIRSGKPIQPLTAASHYSGKG